jgi:hypothetical protein
MAKVFEDLLPSFGVPITRSIGVWIANSSTGWI